MSVLAGAAVLGALLLSRRGRRARLRWRRPRPRHAGRGRAAAVAAVVTIAASVAVASVGTTAVIAGAVVATGLLARRRRRDRARTPPGELALPVDVLAGCLASGASTPAALAAAAVAATPDVATAFTAASLALSRGENPAAAWAGVEAGVPSLTAVARLCARAATTGAAMTEELHWIAASLRGDSDVARRRRLQRASVWLVLPLGLCFLPAFVLVGVVPLIVGTLPGLSR
jgi:Flp pilus assembly protein TadB